MIDCMVTTLILLERYIIFLWGRLEACGFKVVAVTCDVNSSTYMAPRSTTKMHPNQ